MANRAMLLALDSADPPAGHDGMYPRDALLAANYSLGEWSRRWPEVFGDMSGPWLSYLGAVERAYLAVWAEEISWMEGDESWAAELLCYLSCLDDPGSVGFRKALAQSAIGSDGKRLEPADTVGLVTAGYTWACQAPWETDGPGL